MHALMHVAELPESAVDRASNDSLLTKPELANRIRKSVRTVDQWMKQGRLPYMKVGAKTVLFSWPDVLQKLAQHRVN